MPEMAEVELIRVELSRKLVGLTIQQIDTSLRYGHLCNQLLNQTITSVNRRGKFLLLTLDNMLEFVIHLGMTGSILIREACSGFPKHTHFQALLVKDDRKLELLFVDPRRFGKVYVTQPGNYKGLLAKLGPEIFEENHPRQIVLRSKKPIKAILLDQQFMAGLGNYLCDELLFDAKILPSREGRTLSPFEIERIIISARKVAKGALSNGGLSFSDYVNTEGKSGNFQQHLQAYGRQGGMCNRCSATLSTMKVAGRTTVFCGGCQG